MSQQEKNYSLSVNSKKRKIYKKEELKGALTLDMEVVSKHV